MNFFIVLFGKILSKLIVLLNLGGGATWPGHIALVLNPKFIREILRGSKTKIILVAGTNGKTTTSKLIQHILETSGETTLHNASGANLINGIASSLILDSNLLGRMNKNFAILEVDENTLPHALKEFTPDFVLLLNLFRDQLDRYGEVNTIAQNWEKAIKKLPKKTTLILNANDPVIAFLKGNGQSFYFSLDENSSIKHVQDWADSVFCPSCNSRLNFSKIYFSHIGIWDCRNCGLKTPKPDITNSFFPLLGTYNKLNALAAVLTARKTGIAETAIEKSLKSFNPAFGRQEKIRINGRIIQILLSKNPTGFNESLNTIKNAKYVLLALNDRIPDGRDVSWIWDIDFENYRKFAKVLVTGDRTFDLALRFKYASFKNFDTEPNLEKAIKKAINKTPKNQTLHILPTYSAMLEIRKILTGKKIL